MSVTNRYEAEQETKERSHSNFVHQIAQSKLEAKEYLTEAEILGVPPYRTIINTNPPTPYNIQGIDVEQSEPIWADALRGLHGFIIEFWQELKPYRERVHERWTEPIEKIEVPKLNGYTKHSEMFDQEYEQRTLTYSTVELTLKDIGKHWRFQNIRLDCKHNGEQTVRQEKLYLPPVACRAIYEELNDILEELGLAAEVRDAETSANDPGLPDDIEEWGGDQNVENRE